MNLKYDPDATYDGTPRPLIQYLKERFGDKKLIGVEIGVYQGSNAIDMLETLTIDRLYLIDPYEEYFDQRDNKKKAFSASSLRCARRYMMHAMKKSKDRNKAVIIKKTSHDAYNEIPNGLDFVYIDGAHSYEFVKQDIDMYFKKLKESGVIGGDDYKWYCPGVIRAVNEFVGDNKHKLYSKEYKSKTFKNKRGWISNCEWWIIK